APAVAARSAARKMSNFYTRYISTGYIMAEDRPPGLSIRPRRAGLPGRRPGERLSTTIGRRRFAEGEFGHVLETDPREPGPGDGRGPGDGLLLAVRPRAEGAAPAGRRGGAGGSARLQGRRPRGGGTRQGR